MRVRVIRRDTREGLVLRRAPAPERAEASGNGERDSFSSLVRTVENYIEDKNTHCSEDDGQIHPAKFQYSYDRKTATLTITAAAKKDVQPRFFSWVGRTYSKKEAIQEFETMCKNNTIEIITVLSKEKFPTQQQPAQPKHQLSERTLLINH